jgi:malate dehydrogenase (oxaloacetate-decarboxylating)(NADP+)
MKTGVARKQIDIEEYREQLELRQGKGQQVRHYILNQAKAVKVKKRVVFAEGEETKIIRAAAQICTEGIAEPILLGRPDVIKKRAEELGVECSSQIIDPENSDLTDGYAEAYYQTRQRKGVTLKYARKQLDDANVFGLMMVKQGDADAFVSGLTSDYPEVIRPALQIHHTADGMHRAAGVYIMILNNEVFLFTDATVNIEPNAEDLSEIACMAADFAGQLGLNPRVAMLSFSNFGSTPHPLSDKVRKAVQIVKANRPDIAIDGEMQADTAVVIDIVEERYPFSSVKDANVLVFPSLESANIAYKLLHRLGKAQMIGPILLGIGAPVHVLQTGDDVRNIVNIAAMAVMDAEKRSKKKA